MMKLATPPRPQALPAIRAMKTVAEADGALDPQERRMIELALDAYTFTETVDALAAITPEALASTLTDRPARRELIQRLVMLVTLDGEVSDDELRLVEAYAAALDVDEPCVRALRHLVEGRLRRMMLGLLRRSFFPDLLRTVWRQQGALGFVRLGLAMLGLDRGLATRFQALGELPADTLGNALYHQYVDNGFTQPGRAGGPPSPMLFHDLGHVIAGVGTQAEEEMLVCAFQCGYMGERGLVMYVIIAMLFQLGVEPIAKLRGVEPHKRLVDVDRFQAAYETGQRLDRSLIGWDPWPHMHRPVAEVRAELGLG